MTSTWRKVESLTIHLPPGPIQRYRMEALKEDPVPSRVTTACRQVSLAGGAIMAVGRQSLLTITVALSEQRKVAFSITNK